MDAEAGQVTWGARKIRELLIRRLAADVLVAATLASAQRDAERGKTYDLPDAKCDGLQLRVRGGRAYWTVRLTLQARQRRWEIAGADTDSGHGTGARDGGAGAVPSWHHS